MSNEITGKTKILGIIGCPVSHSLSPLMQNAALQALGLDYVYVPFLVTDEGVAAAVNGLRHLGVEGFNVTIPHKTAIIPLLDRLDPAAAFIGAVNTVKREGTTLIGYNTDGIGLIRSLQEDLGFSPTGTTVLVLGAGGAGRGAVAALCEAGVAAIIVANRSRDKGEALLADFRGKFADTKFILASLELADFEVYLRDSDLLVNTTSVGMNGTYFAGIDLSALKPGAMVYDMVYAPIETHLLAAARDKGIRYANGIGMLVAQGEAAFAIWTGQKPPAGVMKKRLLQTLA